MSDFPGDADGRGVQRRRLCKPDDRQPTDPSSEKRTLERPDLPDAKVGVGAVNISTLGSRVGMTDIESNKETFYPCQCRGRGNLRSSTYGRPFPV